MREKRRESSIATYFGRSVAMGTALFAAGAALGGCGASTPAPEEPQAVSQIPPSPPASAEVSPSPSASAEAPPSPPPEAQARPLDTPRAEPREGSAKPVETQVDDAKSPEAKSDSSSRPPARAVVVPASLEGKLVSRSGSLLVIDVPGPVPTLGSKATLYRHFEQQIGPLHTTGWLGIADVTVKDVKGSTLYLTLVAEKSSIVVNGKKVNHFEPGNEVKLELAR